MKKGDIRYDPVNGNAMEFDRYNQSGMAVFRDLADDGPVSYTICVPETMDYHPRHIFQRSPEQRKVKFAYETYPQQPITIGA